MVHAQYISIEKCVKLFMIYLLITLRVYFNNFISFANNDTSHEQCMYGIKLISCNVNYLFVSKLQICNLTKDKISLVLYLQLTRHTQTDISALC